MAVNDKTRRIIFLFKKHIEISQNINKQHELF